MRSRGGKGGSGIGMGCCACRWNDSVLYESRWGCCGPDAIEVKSAYENKLVHYSSTYRMRTRSHASASTLLFDGRNQIPVNSPSYHFLH